MSADRTTVDVGRSLREARERRGVSLRQIANATKISVSALEALERNDIARLPGGIFSRAFVRSYAVEVGLDPEETVHNFIAQFPDDSVTAGHPASSQVEDHEAVESNRRSATTFLRLFLVSVPIAGAVLYFGIVGPPRSDREAPAAPEAAVATASEAAPSPTSASSPAEAGAVAVPLDAPIDRLSVTLSVTRLSWVSATVDGELVIERELQAGEQTTFEARRELVLKAGDAEAVVMTVNGALARPLGKAGEVVTARLNLSNFKEYLQVR